MTVDLDPDQGAPGAQTLDFVVNTSAGGNTPPSLTNNDSEHANGPCRSGPDREDR
jgi:hypothetical protein